MKFHLLNGDPVRLEDAALKLNDVGLLRGYGIFDFFPIAQCRAVFAEDYFDRFYRSATEMRLTVPVDRVGLAAQIQRLCELNGHSEGYIKLVLTGGYSENGYTPGDPNLMVIQHGSIEVPDECYAQGIQLLLQRFARPASSVKSLNYANAIRHRDLIQRQDAIDVLYHDGQCVYETSRANFLVVLDGVLRTGHDHILSGITRKQVLLAAEGILPIEIAPLMLEEVSRASEAMITSTTKGVLPVTAINGHPLGEGEVGPIARQLHQALQERKQRYLESHPGVVI